MKAAVLRKIKAPLELVETDTPSISDDEVLVRVAACGVCHTDLKVMTGELSGKLPTVLGHEVSGTIEEVGQRCNGDLTRGDRVIIGLRYKCGTCEYCLTGRENLCVARPTPKPLAASDGAMINRWNMGGFSEYLAVPQYVVSRLPDNLPLIESSILGCRVTTAFNAVVNRAHVEPNESALVIGCGGVGVNIIQLLRMYNAYPIIAVDLVPSRLEAAKRFGATHIIDAAKVDSVVKSVKQLTKNLGVNKGFEAIGMQVTSDQVVQSVRPGGTAVLVGAVRGQLSFSDASFAFREINVTGVAMRKATDLRKVLELAARGEIDPREFVTNTYPLGKINEAYNDLDSGKIGIMGTIVM